MVKLIFLLFMILFSREDGEGAVDALEQQHAHELVREGHLGKGQAQICPRLDARVKTVGGADDEADLAAAVDRV